VEASLPPETLEDPASRLGAKMISRALRRMPTGTVRRPRVVNLVTRGVEPQGVKRPGQTRVSGGGTG
jgi:hypothetical protein